MSRPKRIVVALGGNAITPPDSIGDVPSQFARTREVSVPLADAIQAGHQLVLTHGNGPQVGNILRRVELASKEVYTIDLGLCVADSEAGMGYMICQCMSNELSRRGVDIPACTVVTTVLVDADDPAFDNPTKPIGTFYTKREAEQHKTKDGWSMVEVPGVGYRRIVPSPRPKAIQELDQIRALVRAGGLVVCAGGGGIPVVFRPGWGHEGVEAVIDKDLTAAMLAVGVEADMLTIITDVERVCLNFGKPDETAFDSITVAQARRYLDEGQFPPGSMGPKIEAAINFLRDSDKPDAGVLITSIHTFGEALAGRTGTRIVRD
jgi:carbamate kinase